MPTVKDRLAREEKIVRRLIEKMAEKGWILKKVFDGEEYEKTETADEAVEVVFSVDESHIVFQREKDTHWVLVILGNDCDCLSDYSYSDRPGDDFNEIMQDVQVFSDELEGAK